MSFRGSLSDLPSSEFSTSGTEFIAAATETAIAIVYSVHRWPFGQSRVQWITGTGTEPMPFETRETIESVQESTEHCCTFNWSKETFRKIRWLQHNALHPYYSLEKRNSSTLQFGQVKRWLWKNNLKRKKCETLYDDFVTAAATYFCAKEEP